MSIIVDLIKEVRIGVPMEVKCSKSSFFKKTIVSFMKLTVDTGTNVLGGLLLTGKAFS